MTPFMCKPSSPFPASTPLARRRSSRPRAWTRALLGATGLALLLSASCGKDVRISVQQMNEREAILTAEVKAATIDPSLLSSIKFPPYTVGANDVLALKILGLEDASPYLATLLQVRVDDDGGISLPVVGPVHVAGLTLTQVEQEIIKAHVLAKIAAAPNNLAVFVELLEPHTTTVLVLGAVETPGFVRLRSNERNVLYALAAASGFGIPSAGLQSVPVTSGRVRYTPIATGRETMVYNLANVGDVQRALIAPPLEPGDILFVESSQTPAIYLSGLVNRPGPILIPPDSTMSITQAVSAAGGLRDYITARDATLVREMPDGSQMRVKLQLNEILEGRCPDLALRSGDVLHVPLNCDTFMQEWALRNIVPGPFNVSLHYDPLAQYNANRALSENFNGTRVGIRQTLASTIPSLVLPPVQVNP